MLELGTNYSVKFIDEPFHHDGKLHSDKTVRVSFSDEYNNHVKSIDYGQKSKEEVYALLESENNINLDFSYIRDFSLSEYRKSKGLGQNDKVIIKNISLVSAFFESTEEIDFSDCEFQLEDANFSKTVFGHGNLNFFRSTFTGNVDFSDTIYMCRDVNFQYAEFGPGVVSFRNARFLSRAVSFVNAVFHDGKVSFSTVNFGNALVAFQFAKFGKGDLTFEKSYFFGDKIDFSKVEFGDGRVDFRLCQFGDGNIIFDESEFGEGKVRFRKVIFGECNLSFELTLFGNNEVSFERSHFDTGKLTFYQAEVGSLVFHEALLNNFIDFRLKRCGNLDLAGCIVRDIIDFTNEDNWVQIDVINMSGMRLLGKMFIDWQDNKVYHAVYGQKNSTNRQKAEQFRLLKENYNQLGHYNDEDKAYLEFKRLELKEYLASEGKKSKWNLIWAYPMYWGQVLLFDKIGHYATNPVRVLISMLIAFWGFTFLYVFLIHLKISSIESSLGDPDHLSVMSRSVYHSAITFLTIGYGDYYPSGIIRWISSIEGFAGLFLMSYFTVAFVRKILR